MKTLKISDDVHQKLTSLLGELMAQTSKMQTYQDAIEAMLSRSVILPSELLAEIENFVEENKQLGYTTREEFMRDAARWRLKFLRENLEYVGIPRKDYERLDDAVKKMNTPFHNAFDFIHRQVESVLDQYDEWIEKKEGHNRKRKRA
ncbi:hypothetical protein KAU92_06010 [Candidatus Bathyarchaeota archaeon]|nr:hypothetical protein [Candidatus Bathyarchaeota archaeon]